MDPFLDGLLAGYGIAIPVGAIAVLIVDTGLQRGFRGAFLAGTGAASADLVYALIAVLAGEQVGTRLAPHSQTLQFASAAVLILIGAAGLRRVGRRMPAKLESAEPVAKESLPSIYFRFFGLTLMNPQTIAYFAALILGRDAGDILTASGQVSFVIAAALASWSWQSLLALVGAVARRRLKPSFHRIAGILGNSLVLAFGVRILVSLAK